MFYRVELNSSGQVIGCEQVKYSDFERSKRVFLVEADSAEVAGSMAFQLYRSNQRNAQRVRRARYIAEGRCPECGDPPKEPFKRCESCIQKNKDQHVKSRARRAGQIVLPTSKSAAFAEKRRSREASQRVLIFKEVLRNWHLMKPQNFLRWLETEAKTGPMKIRRVA